MRRKLATLCFAGCDLGTLGAKSVVRDVGRVLGWSYTDADRLAKIMPTS